MSFQTAMEGVGGYLLAPFKTIKTGFDTVQSSLRDKEKEREIQRQTAIGISETENDIRKMLGSNAEATGNTFVYVAGGGFVILIAGLLIYKAKKG